MIEIEIEESLLRQIITEKIFDQGFYVNPARVKLNIISDSPKYMRTKILPDNNFFQFVEEKDLNNPPSWAIFFGLVELNKKKPANIIEKTGPQYVRK